MFNKKGYVLDVIVWMIIGFVTILILGGLIYGFSIMGSKLSAIPNMNGVNIADAADKTVLQVTNAMPLLKYVAYAILFTMILSIFISNYFVRSHPISFVLYVVVSIIAVIFSAYIANQYELLLTTGPLASTLGEFTAANYVMLYLPVWVTIIGVIGGVILAINIIRDPDAMEVTF